jgi:hypothetical protein
VLPEELLVEPPPEEDELLEMPLLDELPPEDELLLVDAPELLDEDVEPA